MPRTFTGPAGSYRVTIRKDLGWTVLRVIEGHGDKIVSCGMSNRQVASSVAEDLSLEGKSFNPERKGKSGYLVDAVGMNNVSKLKKEKEMEDQEVKEVQGNGEGLQDEPKLSSVSGSRKTDGAEPRTTQETDMATATEETTETTEKPKRKGKAKASAKKAAPKKAASKATTKKATDAKPRASADEFGDRVVELREGGASWRNIAEELELGTPGVARRIWSQATGQHHSLSRTTGRGGRLPKDPEVLAQMKEAGVLTEAGVPEELEALVGVPFSELKANDLKAAVKATGVEPEGRKKSDLVRALMGAGLPEPEGTPEA